MRESLAAELVLRLNVGQPNAGSSFFDWIFVSHVFGGIYFYMYGQDIEERHKTGLKERGNDM